MQFDKKYNYAALGMILGTAIGGAIGMVLLALTGQAIYIAIAGLGTAIGLILGAGIDQAKYGDCNFPPSP